MGMIPLGGWFVKPTAEKMLEPTPEISPQDTSLWSIHVDAFSSSDGTDLFVAAGKISDICKKVTFFAEYLGTPTPFEGKYVDASYQGSLENFFPENPNMQEAELEANCELPDGKILATNTMRIRRYYAPPNTPVDIVSKDNNARLSTLTTSLNTSLCRHLRGIPEHPTSPNQR